MGNSEMATPSRRAGIGMVACLGFGNFAIGTDMFATSALIPGISRSLNASHGSVGLAFSAYSICFAIGALVFGVASRRLPSHLTLTASMALFVFGSLVSMFATSVTILVLARAITAFGTSAYVPMAGIAALRIMPRSHHGRALGIVTAGSSLAMVLGAPLSIYIGSTRAWQTSFFFVAILGTAAIAVLLRARITAVPASVESSRSEVSVVRMAFSLPSVTTLGLSLLAMAASFGSFTYLPILLSDQNWFDAGLMSGIVAGFGLFGVAGIFVGGAMADGRKAQLAVLASLLGMTSSFLMLPFLSKTFMGTLAIAAIWGFSGWALIPVQQYRVVHLPRTDRSFAIALHSATVNAGAFIGTALGATVVDGFGVAWICLMSVLLCALALVTFFPSAAVSKPLSLSSTG
ncbi:MFS transporter [Streptomyces cinereoruber]|uniref:MFS transporter n=1 Tax=Streptomyces cinereoruber TaxID=67260 RepID=UPI003636B80E